MLVQNNRKCQIAASHQILGDKKNKDGSPEIKAQAAHTLLPGLNDVPMEQWKVLREHPQVKQFMELGDIEEPQGDKETDADKKLAKLNPGQEDKEMMDHLCEMKPKDAISAVSQTIDKGLLDRWHQAEKRSDVKKAIEDQLEKLDPKEGDFRNPNK